MDANWFRSVRSARRFDSDDIDVEVQVRLAGSDRLSSPRGQQNIAWTAAVGFGLDGARN